MNESLVQKIAATEEKRAEHDIAIDYLRSFVILLVVVLHASMAYVSFGTYDPADWMGSMMQVVNPQRLPILDLVSLFIYTFCMPLMFLLSGLYAFSELERKGTWGFVYSRLRRLGIPFVISIFLIAPVTYVPSYLLSNSVTMPYLPQFFTADGWLIGPAWFLWILLVFDLAIALIHRYVPSILRTIRRDLSNILILLISVASFAIAGSYISPEHWIKGWGPFDFQPGKILLYLAYFLMGIAISGGKKWKNSGWPKAWGIWFLMGELFLLAYVLIPRDAFGGLGSNMAFAASCAGNSLGILGAFRRFAAKRNTVVDRINRDSFGIFLFHYTFVLWPQYACIPLAIPVWAKFTAVLLGSLFLSICLTRLAKQIPALRKIL